MLWFERRWVEGVLASFASADVPGFSPAGRPIDYVGTFLGMREHARPLARLGLRMALWLVMLAPLWLFLRAQLFVSLSREEREDLLQRLLAHRVYAVREAAFLLKLAACLALFADDELRARSRYDGPTEPRVALRKGERT